MIPKISSLEFLSRECKIGKHYCCIRVWNGLGLEVYCYCNCHDKNKSALAQVEGPSAKAVSTIPSSKEVILDDY